jgi:hypothetical protein
MYLGAVDRGRRAQQPQLMEGVGWVIGMLPAECLCHRARFAALPGQRQGGHQRELRAAAAGIAFERLAKQPYRCFGAPEQQLGKSGVKKIDAVPALCRIERMARSTAGDVSQARPRSGAL